MKVLCVMCRFDLCLCYFTEPAEFGYPTAHILPSASNANRKSQPATDKRAKDRGKDTHIKGCAFGISLLCIHSMHCQ